MYGKAYASLMTTISATNARANFYELIDEISASGKRVAITKKGETKAVLMSIEELESWEETNEILSDKKKLAGIRQSLNDVKTSLGQSGASMRAARAILPLLQ